MNGPETPAASGLSFPRRLIGVFLSPASVFDDLRQRPAWLAPFVTLVAVALVMAVIIPGELIREMIESQMARRGDVTPEQLEAAAKVAGVTRYAGALLGPTVSVLVTAAALFLIFSLLAGGEARFKHYFAVTTHAFLIQALGMIVTTPVAIAQEDLETRLSFALLAPGLDSGFVYALLNGISIFGVWTAVVLGIGGARVSRSVSTGAAVGIVLGLYGLFVLGSAVIATVTGTA